MTWWYNSGNGGDLGGRVTRAIDELKSPEQGDEPGQETATESTGPERAAVIDGVVEKILKIYVYPDVAKRMEQAIRDRQAKKEYDTISSCRELAKVLTRDLREVCKDEHLEVQFFAKGIPYDSEKKPDPEGCRGVPAERIATQLRVQESRTAGRRDRASPGGRVLSGRVDRRDGGGRDVVPGQQRSVILDLRQNNGGQSGGTLLCSYFFKEETHLTDVYNRPENTTRQVWSYPVAGARSSRTRTCTS